MAVFTQILLYNGKQENKKVKVKQQLTLQSSTSMEVYKIEMMVGTVTQHWGK